MQDITTRGFLELGEKFVNWYMEGKFDESKIQSYKSFRECLYECYKALVRTKQLMPIEEMAEAEKRELWKECIKYCLPLDNRDRIKFVKAYAALSCLMKKRL